MSIETWVKEFYPIEAEECYQKNKERDKAERDIALLDHSILKWRGFLIVNLERHAVTFEGVRNYLYGTCVLCRAYDDPEGVPDPFEEDEYYNWDCQNCPILSFSRRKCTDPLITLKKSEWKMGYEDKNPLPMIFLLEATRVHTIKNQKS